MPATGGTWADCGAGTGTFTLALASLVGPDGVIHAIDLDERALAELARAARRSGKEGAMIRLHVADFTTVVGLPELDGVVIANALHFIPADRQAAVLAHLAGLVKSGGALVVVEYDRREANRWVPFPITPGALAIVAREAGLNAPELLATRPSRYSGTLYSAVVRRPAHERPG